MPADSIKKRIRLGPLVGVALVLGVLGPLVYWFAMQGGAPPERVYVAARGEPSAWARGVRDAIALRLAREGLDVVDAEGAESPSDVDFDQALAAAEEAGAHYLVHVDLIREADRPGLTEGTHFAIARGELRVAPLDTEEAELGEARTLTFGAEGRGDAEAALLETVSSFAEPFGHWAAGDLFEMPALVASIEETGRHGRSEEAASALGEALEKKTAQAQSLVRYQEACVESVVLLTIDDERGPAPIACFDLGCGEQYLFDLAADGQTALVHVEAPTSFIPFAPSPAPRLAETLERLELVRLDGGEARTVAVAQSFYGYGSLSSDASRAVYIEQASRRFGVVALDVETGARQVLTLVERPGLVPEAAISPDGEWVAIHRKAFNRAHTELHVTRFDTPAPAVVSRRTRVGRWVVVPLRPGEEPRQLLAFDGTESYEGAPRPALVDPERPDDVVEIDVGEHLVRQVVGAHDGVLVFLGSAQGDVDHCAIGLRDPESGEVAWTPLGTCVDGAGITDRFELAGAAVVSREDDPEATDTEAIVMNLETGDTSVHTTNRAAERNVRVAGAQVVFERTVRSEFPGVHPSAVCWTER